MKPNDTLGQLASLAEDLRHMANYIEQLVLSCKEDKTSPIEDLLGMRRQGRKE